jgi:hypothetical protein
VRKRDKLEIKVEIKATDKLKEARIELVINPRFFRFIRGLACLCL